MSTLHQSRFYSQTLVKYMVHLILSCSFYSLSCILIYNHTRGRRGRDRMVVELTAIYAISAHHHWCCVFESRSGRSSYITLGDKVCQQFATCQWFSPSSPVSSTNNCHDITKILLSGIKHHQTNKQTYNLTFKVSKDVHLRLWAFLYSFGWSFPITIGSPEVMLSMCMYYIIVHIKRFTSISMMN